MHDAHPTLALIDEILDTHHARIRRELPPLREQHDGELAERLRELQLLMEAHMRKEEQILFPAIQALAEGGDPEGCGLLGPIRQMRHEHDRIRELEQQLRSLSAGASSLTALLDDLALHADKEDTQLFPMALELAGLSPQESEPPAPPPASPPRPSLLRRLARRFHR